MNKEQESQTQVVHLLDQRPYSSKQNESALIKVLRSCSFLPQRYVMGLMGLMGTCTAMTMRICLSVAITQMVNHTKTKDSHGDPLACPTYDVVLHNTSSSGIVVQRPNAVFEWDEETQGFILSGFYYGYILTQVIGGYLSERFGGKWVLGFGLLSTALLTFLTPIVVNFGGATGLFILRVLQGMGEGPTMPGLMTVLSRWAPPQERSFLGAIVFAGAAVGNVFGTFMSGLLLSGRGDWANVFYFFGGFGILWFALWSMLCYSTPNSHPFISQKELDYLNANVKTIENTKDPVPWKAILRSAPVWALLWASVGHDWGYYTMVTDLPKYSHDVLKFDIGTTGTLMAIPYIAMCMACFLSGFVCDYCIKKGWHSIKSGRIFYTTLGATGPAICIILASYAGCNRSAAMVYFILSMGIMGAYYSGMKINALDLAPNFVGSVTSFINTSSTTAGIITPYLVGLLTPDSTLSQWRVVFWVCFGVLVGTNVVYIAWAAGDQQWWDDVRKYGLPEDWKHGPLLKEESKQDEDVKLSCKQNEKM